MKKYIEVFRLSFKMQIIWWFDVVMTVIGTSGRILAAWILWSAAFANRDTVGGFSLNAMLTYYIYSSFLTSLDMSDQISREISYIIRNGQFSKHMVAPMNPLGFFGMMAAGESAFHLFFSTAAVLLCAALFRVHIAFISDPIKIIYAIVMILTGLLFMISFNYFLHSCIKHIISYDNIINSLLNLVRGFIFQCFL